MRNVLRLLSIALLVACSRGFQTNLGPVSVSGVLSAGPINGADIKVHKLKSDGSIGDEIASGKSVVDGKFSINVPSQGDPIIIVATGGGYREEASGAVVDVGNASIRMVLPSLDEKIEVGVTPVTEIAAQHAIANMIYNTSESPAEIIENSNALVADAMGLDDITNAPANPYESPDKAKSIDSAQYALVLASISELARSAASANGTEINSLDMMQALATTFTYNGSFTSKVNAKDVPVPNGSGANITLEGVLGGANSFSSAMQTAADNVKDDLSPGFADTSKVPPPPFTTAPPARVGAPSLSKPVPPATLPNARPKDSGAPKPPKTPAYYPIEVVVSGLSGTLILQNNGGDDLTITSNGAHEFATEVFSGNTFSVSVLTNPTNQSCSVTNATGHHGHSKNNNITVACSATITWGGTIQDGIPGTYVWTQAMARDASGNSYVAGFTLGAFPGQSLHSAMDYYVAKYNSSGTRQWVVQDGPATSVMGGQPSARSEDVSVDSSGNVYVTGTTYGAMSGATFAGTTIDVFVTKYNSSGVHQWTILKGAPAHGYAVTTDPSGNIISAGYAGASLNGETYIQSSGDCFISKYTSAGAHLWTIHERPANQTGSIQTYCRDVITDASGNIYATGWTQSNTSTAYMFVAKYNTAGVRQWIRYDHTDNEALFGGRLVLDSTGAIYAVGSAGGSLDGNPYTGWDERGSFNVPYGYDYAVIKINPDGTKAWSRQGAAGLAYMYYSPTVGVDSNDNIYIAATAAFGTQGHILTSINGYQATGYIVTKYDSAGTRKWTIEKNYAAPYVMGTAVDSSGVYVAGHVDSAVGTATQKGVRDLFVDRHDLDMTLNPYAEASLNKTSWNFSSSDTATSHTFVVTNTGSQNMIISSFSQTGSTAFQNIYQCSSFPILPGGTCKITISFTPSGAGLVTGQFTINYDTLASGGGVVSGAGGTRVFTFQGTGQ